MKVLMMKMYSVFSHFKKFRRYIRSEKGKQEVIWNSAKWKFDPGEEDLRYSSRRTRTDSYTHKTTDTFRYLGERVTYQTWKDSRTTLFNMVATSQLVIN